MSEVREVTFNPVKAMASVTFEDKDLQRSSEREDNRMRRAKRYRKPYTKKQIDRARYFSSLQVKINPLSDLWK